MTGALVAGAIVLGAVLLLLVTLTVVQRRPQVLLAAIGYSLVLTQSFPVFSIGSRAINLSTDHLLIPLAIVVALLSPRTWRGEWPWPRFAVPFLAFAAWALVTFALSAARAGAAAHAGPLVEIVKLVMYTAMFVPAVVFLRGAADARRLLRHLVVGAFIVLAIAYLQWWMLPDRMSANIVSTFGSLARSDAITAKNVLAVYLACWLVVCLALFARGYVGLVYGLGVMILLGLVIVASHSRAALLALAVALGYLALTRMVRVSARFQAVRATLIASVAMMSVVVVLGWSAALGFSSRTPVGQLLNLFSSERDYSQSGLVAGATGTLRLRLLLQGVEAYQGAPIMGYGFGVRGIYLPELAVVDNFPLDVALDTGVVGLILMMWLIWEIVQHFRDVQLTAVRSGDRLLESIAWGAGGVVTLVMAASVSGSFPYTSRILGPLVLATAAVSVWAREARIAALPRTRVPTP